MWQEQACVLDSESHRNVGSSEWSENTLSCSFSPFVLSVGEHWTPDANKLSELFVLGRGECAAGSDIVWEDVLALGVERKYGEN